jgi:hypothetical protein
MINFHRIQGALMKIVHAPLKRQNRLVALFNALALLLLLGISAAAQSTDMEYPTLVRSNELSGTIVPRDLGDPRLTRYFYSFWGTPGDLIVTVESKNLEGDVDVFTASTLRPLAKVSMYAGGTTSSGSKTIYLKTREPLILRVEARTPNDNEGSFRIRFDGAFEPISNDIPDREPVVPTISSTSKNGRRVTATGARIDEPEPAAETAKPEIETPTTPTPTTPAPAETTTAKATTPAPPKPRTPRTRRTRTPTARTARTRPSPTARRTPASVEPPAPAPAVEPASGPRLIIEMRDGMKVERYMTTVRRVTVENGQIVVITKDGKVDRQPMSNVIRMAIEP